MRSLEGVLAAGVQGVLRGDYDGLEECHLVGFETPEAPKAAIGLGGLLCASCDGCL